MISLKAPQISVIVPVYNVEAYLEKCVDSILDQSFSDFELLLIDDGSPDECGRICDDYAEKDQRVRVFHKENGGVSSARNTGLDNCRSKYLTFCDSDDHLEPDWLDKLYNSIRDGAVDLVCGDVSIVDKNGRLIRRELCRHGFFPLESLYQRAALNISYFLNGGNTGSVCKNIFRTGIIKENNIRFCETCGNYAEDLCFMLEYVLYCRNIEAKDITGYNYVLHKGSMMFGSAEKPKFDAVNEVSRQFGSRYLDICTSHEEISLFSVIHYLLLKAECDKVFRSGRFELFRSETKKITNREWFEEHTVRALHSYGLLKEALGRKAAVKGLAYLYFCLYGAPKSLSRLKRLI